MDCLDGMKLIPDKTIDLIVTDPPYNIGKAKWDKIPNYIEWMGAVFKECQRVLKDNGSFYWFHNDMPQIAQLMEWLRANTKFAFKQMIVWNKRFEKARNKGFLDGFIVVDGLRNYQQMCEYCLFYTFQDETGLEQINGRRDCYATIKKYLDNELEASGYTENSIAEVLQNQMASHYFGFSKRNKTQFSLPTLEQYKKLQITGAFRREYESLRREYESLRREYESLRYTFNNQKTHHSVWDYEIASKMGHITPKPVPLIENILLHSSNVGDTVLDCFMGSGTTAIAALNTGRFFVGFEKDSNYWDISQQRISGHYKQTEMQA